MHWNWSWLATAAVACVAAGCPAAESPSTTDRGPDSAAVVQGVGTTSHDGLELRVRIGGPTVTPDRVTDDARELRVMHGLSGPSSPEGEN